MLHKSYDRLFKHIDIKVRNKPANFLINIDMFINNRVLLQRYVYREKRRQCYFYASIQYTHTAVCLQRTQNDNVIFSRS